MNGVLGAQPDSALFLKIDARNVHEVCDSTPVVEEDLKKWNDEVEKWGSEHCAVALAI